MQNARKPRSTEVIGSSSKEGGKLPSSCMHISSTKFIGAVDVGKPSAQRAGAVRMRGWVHHRGADFEGGWRGKGQYAGWDNRTVTSQAGVRHGRTSHATSTSEDKQARPQRMGDGASTMGGSSSTARTVHDYAFSDAHPHPPGAPTVPCALLPLAVRSVCRHPQRL